MIHDLDMARFLLAEEPVELHRRRFLSGRSGDRRRRRCGYCCCDTAYRERQAVPDLQLAPRDLWLRSAYRGAWLEGSAACWQRHRDDRGTGDRCGVRHRSGSAILPGTLCSRVPSGARCVHRRGRVWSGAEAGWRGWTEGVAAGRRSDTVGADRPGREALERGDRRCALAW